MLHDPVEQGHSDFGFLGDFHILWSEEIVDHQSCVQILVDRRPGPVALLKIADKFPEAQGGLKIAFSPAYAPQGLLIELDLPPHKGGPGDDGSRNAVTNVL